MSRLNSMLWVKGAPATTESSKAVDNRQPLNQPNNKDGDNENHNSAHAQLVKLLVLNGRPDEP